MVRFKAKVWKIGTSHVITIPKQLIESELITPYNEYWVEIKNEY